jgi:hypothetical protein
MACYISVVHSECIYVPLIFAYIGHPHPMQDQLPGLQAASKRAPRQEEGAPVSMGWWQQRQQQGLVQ